MNNNIINVATVSDAQGLQQTFTPMVYNYEGNSISFSKENGVMVNATQMAKPFGKIPYEWLRLQSTKEFLDAYIEAKHPEIGDTEKSLFAENQLVKAIKGGLGEQGTWFHQDVALEFARWLSPKFAIWCNDRIKELLQNGVVALPQDYLSALKALVKSEEEKQMLAIENARLDTENNILTKENCEANEKLDIAINHIKRVNPKARSWEKLANTEGLFTISQFASKIGLTAYKVNKFLVEKGIITNNKQRPTYKYIDKHFFECKELLIKTLYGEKKKTQMFITTTGEEFVTNLLYQDGIINIVY